MKNLFFSKKYLITKLCLFTVIMTFLYHLFCKEKVLFTNMIKRNSDFFIINEKKDKVYKNKDDDDDNYDSPFINYKMNNGNFNIELIPSDLVLDYWQSIKERKQSLKIPKISKGINSDVKFRKLDFSEFLESQILKDFINFIKSGKYGKYGKSKNWNIAKDLWIYLNLNGKIWTFVMEKFVPKKQLK